MGRFCQFRLCEEVRRADEAIYPLTVFARERSNPFNANIADNIKLQKDSSDSIESTKDSNVMDCHEFNKLNSRNDESGVDLQVKSRNDGIGVDCHDSTNAESRNDRQRADSYKSQSDSYNDELKTTSHKNTHSYNDKNKPPILTILRMQNLFAIL